MSNVIQSLWIGNHLKPVHIMAMRSFLWCEHEYHLYCYEEIDNVPKGVVIKDAREILPEEAIFVCQTEPGKGSPSPFSDLFRWKLLYEKGGWWVDTDVLCRTHWPDKLLVLASELSFIEHVEGGFVRGEQIAPCVVKLPEKCPLANDAYEHCKALDRAKQCWTDPVKMLNDLVKRHHLNDWVRRSEDFCPVAWWDWEKLFEPNYEVDNTGYGVHLYHEMWRRAGVSDTCVFPEGSFLRAYHDFTSSHCR